MAKRCNEEHADHQWSHGNSAGYRCLRCGLRVQYTFESLCDSTGTLRAVAQVGQRLIYPDGTEELVGLAGEDARFP